MPSSDAFPEDPAVTDLCVVPGLRNLAMLQNWRDTDPRPQRFVTAFNFRSIPELRCK
jgi:hypothetical protein